MGKIWRSLSWALQILQKKIALVVPDIIKYRHYMVEESHNKLITLNESIILLKVTVPSIQLPTVGTTP